MTDELVVVDQDYGLAERRPRAAERILDDARDLAGLPRHGYTDGVLTVMRGPDGEVSVYCRPLARFVLLGDRHGVQHLERGGWIDVLHELALEATAPEGLTR